MLWTYQRGLCEKRYTVTVSWQKAFKIWCQRKVWEINVRVNAEYIARGAEPPKKVIRLKE